MSTDDIPQLESWRGPASSEESVLVRSTYCEVSYSTYQTRLITCRNKVGNNLFCTEQWFCTGVDGNSLRVDSEYKPTTSYDFQQK